MNESTTTPTPQFLYGGSGNDVLEGGDGNDYLRGSGGDDDLTGGAGDDYIEGGAGVDILRANAGDDWLEGGDSNDWLDGGTGNDWLEGGDGNDRLEGGDGNNSLLGGTGSDYLDGGIGDDWLEGGEGNDMLIGGDGSDWLEGGEGDDYLSDYNGNDTLIGGAGDDTLDVMSGDSWLDSGAGDDWILVEEGSHVIQTGTGGDTIRHFFWLQEIFTSVSEIKTESFTDWLTPLGISPDHLSLSQFSAHYRAWVEHLVSEYSAMGLGRDMNGDGIVGVSLRRKDTSGMPLIEGMSDDEVRGFFSGLETVSLQTGSLREQRSFANKFSIETAQNTSTWKVFNCFSGHSVVLDFETGKDSLTPCINALRRAGDASWHLPSEDERFSIWNDALVVSLVDTDRDQIADSTRLTLKDAPDNWSVTLIGVTNFSLDSVAPLFI